MDYSKKTLSYLDKEACRVFSLWIRQSRADEDGNCTCITCGHKGFWRGFDEGHYISRKHKATKFSPMNNHPQCTYCNRTRDGEEKKYRAALVKMFGEAEIVNLERRSKQFCKISRDEYIKLIETLKMKLKEKGFLLR